MNGFRKNRSAAVARQALNQLQFDKAAVLAADLERARRQVALVNDARANAKSLEKAIEQTDAANALREDERKAQVAKRLRLKDERVAALRQAIETEEANSAEDVSQLKELGTVERAAEAAERKIATDTLGVIIAAGQ